jgi:hypothetical protein
VYASPFFVWMILIALMDRRGINDRCSNIKLQ